MTDILFPWSPVSIFRFCLCIPLLFSSFMFKHAKASSLCWDIRNSLLPLCYTFKLFFNPWWLYTVSVHMGCLFSYESLIYRFWCFEFSLIWPWIHDFILCPLFLRLRGKIIQWFALPHALHIDPNLGQASWQSVWLLLQLVIFVDFPMTGWSAKGLSTTIFLASLKGFTGK